MCDIFKAFSFQANIISSYFLAIWHQFDDTIFIQANWLQSLRNKVPFLKSMDDTEGRNIATWAMLPLWEGFTASAASGNMSAWEAIETVKDLAFCMTQTLAEEGGHHTKNVPLSYDFTKVCRHLNCSPKIFWFAVKSLFSRT